MSRITNQLGSQRGEPRGATGSDIEHGATDALQPGALAPAPRINRMKCAQGLVLGAVALAGGMFTPMDGDGSQPPSQPSNNVIVTASLPKGLDAPQLNPGSGPDLGLLSEPNVLVEEEIPVPRL